MEFASARTWTAGGSLYRPKVELDALAGGEAALQWGEFGRLGRAGSGAPVALQPVAGGSSGANASFIANY